MFVYGGNQDLCIFSPWQSVTKITPGFQLGSGTLTKLRFPFVLLSRGWFLFLGAAIQGGLAQGQGQDGKSQVPDIISNHDAGIVPNLIQQKLEVVFSFASIVYLEKKHHIIKTIYELLQEQK